MTTIDAALRASAQRRPDALALADAPNRASVLAGEPQRLSWSEVDAAVDALAEDLARLGVGRGDSVAIQLPNVVELPISILAAIRMGAVAVPFPIQHREHELRHGFTVADVRAVVTADRPDRPEQLASTLSVAAELGRDIPVATFP